MEITFPSEEKVASNGKLTQITFKLFTVVFSLGCFVGFALQVQSISDYFFRYLTITELSVEIPSKLFAPDLSICFRYADIFNTTRYAAEKNVTLSNSTEPEAIHRVQRQVSIEDIFEYTPPQKEMFKKCYTRLYKAYNYESREDDECFEAFDVVNYYLQEFICYRISWKSVANMSHDYRNLAYALSYPGMFFGVELDLEMFKTGDYLKTIVHQAYDFPFKSAAFAPSFTRHYDPKTGVAKYNSFQLSYSMLNVTRLEPPYNTNCKNYRLVGYGSSNDCVRDCLTNMTLAGFDKLPFSTIVRTPMKKKHINTEDIENVTFSTALNKMERACGASCSQQDCSQSYTITTVLKEESQGNDTLVFIVNVPRNPSLEIMFHAKLTLTEYLIYVFSCFGTWFGLSAMNLNPFNYDLYLKWRNKKKNPSPLKGDLDYRHVRRALRTSRQFDLRGGVCGYCMNTRTKLRKEIRDEICYLSSLFARPFDDYAIHGRGLGGKNWYINTHSKN